MTEVRLNESTLSLVALTAPAIAFLSFALYFSVNVPVGDDYLILQNVVDLRRSTDVTEFFSVLFSLRSEHLLVVTRLIAYLASFLPGGLDFRALTLVALLALFMSVHYVGAIMNLARRWTYWLILALLLLQPQQHKLMFYPMAAVQAYVGLLCAVLFLKELLGGNRRGWIAALVIGLLTTAGAAAFPFVGALVQGVRRDWRGVAVQLLLVALIVPLFTLGNNLSGQGFAFASQHVLETFRFFVAIMGSIAEVPSFKLAALSPYFTLPVGFALLAYFCWATVRVARDPGAPDARDELAAVALGAMCIVTVALVAVSRAFVYSDTWASASLDGRYRLFGLLATAVCLIDALRRLERTRTSLAAKAVAVVAASVTSFSLGWYVYRAGYAAASAERRASEFEHWRRTGDGAELPSWANSTEQAAQTLATARELKIFRPDR